MQELHLVTARLGEHAVTLDDLVLADDDGAIIVPLARARDAAMAAASIRDTERRQAAAMRGGSSLREQVRFRDYLDARSARGIGFREHLRDVGGAIEE